MTREQVTTPELPTRLSVFPAYLSRATLAAVLDISESAVDEMVRRGVLPRPVRLSPRCVRWRWLAVDAALASLSAASESEFDPDTMNGVQRAIEAAKERRSR